MRAVVLVGGRGTRLRPLTETVAKPLLPVGLEPILGRVLGALRDAGVDEAVLSLGYRPDDFTAAFPDGVCNGVRVRYAVEPRPLGTGGAIRFAAEAAGIEGTFLVVNGDVLCAAALGALLDVHERTGAHATVSLTEVDDPSAFGVVDLAPDGSVRSFVEKPARHEAPSNLANAGTYVLESAALDHVPPGSSSVERDVFPVLAASGSLFAHALPGAWVDAGTRASYIAANLMVVDGVLPRPVDATRCGQATYTRGAPLGDVAGVSRVLLDADVHIAPGVELHGVVVGAGALIGRDAVVRDSVVLPGARVGARSTVSGSIVGGGASVASGTEIVDRVVGYGEQVAGGPHRDSAHAA